MAGTLLQNLQAALASAKRLRGQPVHRDTIDFWRQLLHHAEAVEQVYPASDAPMVTRLIAELQQELAGRGEPSSRINLPGGE
jgi:hypothetical protein